MNKLILQLIITASIFLFGVSAYCQNNSDYTNPDYSTDSYKHNYSISSPSSSSYTPLSKNTASRTYSGSVLVSPSRSQGSYYATSNTYTPAYKSHASKY